MEKATMFTLKVGDVFQSTMSALQRSDGISPPPRVNVGYGEAKVEQWPSDTSAPYDQRGSYDSTVPIRSICGTAFNKNETDETR